MSVAADVDATSTVIDLHTHSSRSDGTDPSAELVGKAKAAGLTVVALTDHDTTVGWAEGTAAAAEHGIELVRGLEVRTQGTDSTCSRTSRTPTTGTCRACSRAASRRATSGSR